MTNVHGTRAADSQTRVAGAVWSAAHGITSTGMTEMRRFQIRPSTYRGKDGFLITGRDNGRRVRVFAESRAVAEHLRDMLKQGHAITLKDFEPRT